MAKVQTIDFRSFMRGETMPPKVPMKLIKAGAGVYLALVPKYAFASTGAQTFAKLWVSVIGIVDWIAVGVFIFAGVAWMFGHRTKALEHIIGGAAGYLLCKHAVDIRDFLKAL